MLIINRNYHKYLHKIILAHIFEYEFDKIKKKFFSVFW